MWYPRRCVRSHWNKKVIKIFPFVGDRRKLFSEFLSPITWNVIAGYRWFCMHINRWYGHRLMSIILIANVRNRTLSLDPNVKGVQVHGNPMVERTVVRIIDGNFKECLLRQNQDVKMLTILNGASAMSFLFTPHLFHLVVTNNCIFAWTYTQMERYIVTRSSSWPFL